MSTCTQEGSFCRFIHMDRSLRILVLRPVNVVDLKPACTSLGQLDLFGHKTKPSSPAPSVSHCSHVYPCPPGASWDGQLP